MGIELTVPSVGESITEVEIGDWLKKKGDRVQKDETLVTLESEKATVELPAPEAGTVSEILKKKGEVANVGEIIGYLETDGREAVSASPARLASAAKPPEPKPQPATQKKPAQTQPEVAE